MTRRTRQVGTLVLTAVAIAYLIWKVDLGTTLDVLADTNLAWFALSVTIMVATVPVLALRWGWLLAAHAIHERVPWLTRAVLRRVHGRSGAPDVARRRCGARRRDDTTSPRASTVVTGTVLLERGFGGAATVALGAIGFLLSIGQYDVSAYLWLEGVFVFGTLVLGFLFFAALGSAAAATDAAAPRAFRLERPLRAFLRGIHHYRGRPALLAKVLAVTFAVQTVRILAIWAAAKAVGIDLDPRIYYVFGPLLFLVMLVPFTLNGLAVREAFFVSFLGSVGVGAEPGVRSRLPLLPRHAAAGVPRRRDHAPRRRSRRRRRPRSSMADASRVAVVVVTYDALPWIEQCLDVGARGRDGRRRQRVERRHGRVRARAVSGRPRDRGREPRSRRRLEHRAFARRRAAYALLLNADAWLAEGALERLVDFADTRPRAAVVGPRLLNPDGTLQRSVRGFPTLWRLATEYLFLRKLAPGSSALNAFYAGGFDHDEVREVEVVMGACMLLRREAIEQVGDCDEDYFLFSEETDWCFRFREAGWQVVFFPGAECVHVRGASHSGRLYRENLRGHLLFLSKHRGPKVAERARRLLLVSLRLRGLSFRGERGRVYRDGAAWLASGDVAELVAR